MTDDKPHAVASNALLACPYCQCPAILHHVLSEYWISCSDGYDCQFETDFHKTPEEAEAEWNALCEKANTSVCGSPAGGEYAGQLCSPLDRLREALREHEANKPPFTFDDLKESLVRHGIIQPGAVDDAELYDGYRTLDRLSLVWSDLVKAWKANQQ